MNSYRTRKIIQTYVDGWKENNINKILKALTNSCVIVESHGPTYHGTDDVKDWVNSWKKDGYKVNRWDIISFLYSKNTTVFEWVFEFSSDKTEKRTIEGITIAKFKDKKIVYLREYRTTKSLYDWKRIKKLDAF
ncbi:MAG: putative cytosolic protein [Candidatus Levybacteria bacterium GW2011_GWA2_37_36]|uniref:Putative cytosolic protein n=1 Tax=Candidatus Roizmanbacteria bacterium GW2011_GWC2_34_23 TaxID=1618484 RepID=A0A0G0AWF3_9BACT|nr:MAG: putative cytosolic protein [Candidatus Roizmanbacteria bacterium GW2011_GWC2_34_23]KKQ33763.1 MAG: putative cytosolic protein [Candidatus Levybacteria bacterium GW2011_GWA2_37_36]